MYKYAPLVYVTALVKTSALPKLTSDQTALLEQALIEDGFIHSARSFSSTLSFRLGASEMTGANDEVIEDELEPEEFRKGFFSESRTDAIVVAPSAIEWRTTDYSSYDELRSKFRNVIGTISRVVPSYGKVIVNEVVLNYSDVIVPKSGRRLSDYFAEASHLLPLSPFESFEDVQQVGTLSVTRITNPTQKISLFIEQLPTNDGRPSKLVPNSMLELDREFGMPLPTRDDWKDSVAERTHYALMLTQASNLVRYQLVDYLESDIFQETHELTSNTFRSLINDEVCDVDWLRTESREKS